MQELLYERLRDDAGYGALAGDRYFTGARPAAGANATMPLAVGRLVSSVQHQAMGSFTGVRSMRVQITCFADTPAAARTLAAAVADSLHRWRADPAPANTDTPVVAAIYDVMLDQEMELYDQDAGLHTCIQDWMIHVRET